ncbi:threonine--tRNA ligase, mitochondrial 1-like protein [Tanacetum coccineum]
MEGSSSSDLDAVLGFRIILLVKRSTWSVRQLCNESGEIALGDMPSGMLSLTKYLQTAAQDDAHIFCRESQIKEEVKNVLEFISYAYAVFGFTFDLKLSTDAKWMRLVIGQNG